MAYMGEEGGIGTNGFGQGNGGVYIVMIKMGRGEGIYRQSGDSLPLVARCFV